MKKIAVLIFCVLVFGIFFVTQKKGDQSKQVLPAAVDNTVSSTPEIPKQVRDDKNTEKRFLFVPYWGMTQERIPDSYGDILIYFGIAPHKEGINKEEDGYMGLARFEAISKGRETFLTLRMIDQDISFSILKDKKLQEKIIGQTLDISKQYGFKGIVLDLEISSLPFASVTEQMNSFVEEFSKTSKKENLTFSMMFFGDTFYKLRPYDTLVLRQYVDSVFVMAYDFSKAKGDPGPNFPFSGKDKYGYDFTLMVEDFLNVIPKEKLVIVFGMFGYDWTVDDHNKSTGLAQARTLIIAKKQFIEQCLFKNCNVKRDETSAETKVSYTDNQENNHIMWFEDEESMAKKSEFLKEKGINAVGFWAYSYF